MRYRPLLAAALTVTVAATLPAHAAVKKLDGKKTKALTFAAAATPQDNDAASAADVVNVVGVKTPADRPDYAHCPKSRCLTYRFLYKPAKGVKRGPFSVKISWSIPGEDFDLYVLQNGADVGHCGASAGTSETVVVATPVPGKVYTVVVDEFRAGPDTVKGSITFPAKDKIGTTAPSTLDNLGVPTNCGLS